MRRTARSGTQLVGEATVRLNAGYLMKELFDPRIDRLLEDRAGRQVYHPIDATRFFHPVRGEWRVIDESMFELFDRRETDFNEHYFERRMELPQRGEAPLEPQQVDAVWEFFDDRVDRASLYLHALSPDDYVFYRKLEVVEDSIFEGLDALRAGYSELDLAFSAIPAKGRELYEQFNARLQAFARVAWPSASLRPARLMLLLYTVFAELLRPESTLPGYWLGMAKAEHNRDEIRSMALGQSTEWSAGPRVREGDCYVMYCTAPDSAILGVFRAERSWCDPTGAWKGCWAQISKVATGSLTFADMHDDPTLRDWAPVKRQFQWTTVEAIPARYFNRVREMLVERGMSPSLVDAADIAEYWVSGSFEDEKAFDEGVIMPLLRERLRLPDFDYQHPVPMWNGSKITECAIDFLVRDERGREITIFEDKKEFREGRHEWDAYWQARSYALQKLMRSFVIAAPQELRFYGRRRTEPDFPKPEEPIFRMTWEDANDPGKLTELRNLIDSFGPAGGR